MEEKTILDSALEYALDFNWSVFPTKISKDPYTPKGYHDAKTDRRAIKHWWGTLFPDAGIGISCEASNLLVIDVDKDDEKGIDGYQSLKQWERDTGYKLPETATVVTGRGGMHLYYHYEYDGTDNDPKNRAGVLEGVDIRANGYVIAPPSLHSSGRRYMWDIGPDELLTDADEAVLAFCKQNSSGSHVSLSLSEGSIPPGERNATLYKLACSMQSKGYPDKTILVSIKSINEERCSPPLDDEEIEKIVESALKYEKGKIDRYYDEGTQHDPVLQRSKKGGVLQTIPNCEEAIEFDRDLYGRILFNELSNSIYIYGNMPWDIDYSNSRKVREWKNVDDSNLLSYMQQKYGLNHEKNLLTHALTNVANRHRFNPVINFLESCEDTYDGGAYVQKLLPKYLGVEDTPYTYEVMHLFMMGAVCRIFNPGTKFDYMMIIVGDQGVGKSAFLRMLAGSDMWFSDNLNTLEGDKASEKLRGMWIVEVAELLAMKRSKEVEAIKSFITLLGDIYRVPYSRRTEKFPRRCVFAGTTNDRNFLTDSTGNRRFLPVEACKENQEFMVLDNPEEAASDIMKAWGEIMVEYKALVSEHKKPNLVLSAEGREEASKRQNEYLEEDVRIGIIQDYLDMHTEINRVCVAMICENVLNMAPKDIAKRVTNEIHAIMRNKIVGWLPEGKQRCAPYGVVLCYRRAEKPVDFSSTATLGQHEGNAVNQ